MRKASRFKILPEASPFVYKEKIYWIVTANLQPSTGWARQPRDWKLGELGSIENSLSVSGVLVSRKLPVI
jgi:hypothetical protein